MINDIPEQYPVGTQFTPRKKGRSDLETVIDFHTTTNLAGDIVSTCYVIEHEFMGQKIRSTCNKTTIPRALGFTSARDDDFFRISGGNMDMIFQAHYQVIRDLHSLGFITKKMCGTLEQNTPHSL